MSAPSLWAAAEPDFIDGASKEEQVIRLAGDYFQSLEKIQQTIAKMEKDMRESAKALQFEKAAELRDRVKRLKMLALGL